MKQVTLSTYVLTRLKELNTNHIFGIPGDYVLPFFDEILDGDHGVKHIMPRNELNGTYAADGYAKQNGFGAMAVTFGVGSLSCTNAVAGAYADDTPIVVISGTPTVDVLNTPTERRYHHVIENDFNTNIKVFEHITVASHRVEKIETATFEIDNMLRKAMQYKKPIYLEIPYDLQTMLVDVPSKPLDLMLNQSSNANLNEALEVVYKILHNSKTRSVVTGHLIQREGLVKQGVELVDQLNAAVATTFTCKMGDFEEHPNSIGIYMGEVSEDYTKEMVDGADVSIGLGVTFNEFDTGVFSTQMGKNQNVIWLRKDYVEVNGKRYDQVYLREFLPALLGAVKDIQPGEIALQNRRKFAFEHADRFEPTGDALTIDRLFVQFSNYLEKGDMLYGDTGGFINSSQAEFPADVIMHGCGNWGSLGAGFGMYVGANFANEANNRRSISIQGEGAFTMSAQDLATLIEHKKDLALFILDNAGYGAERAIHPGKERSYNDIAVWKYEKLGEALGGTEGEDVHSFVAHTEKDMAEIFAHLKEPKGINIVRIMLDPNDSATFNLRFSQLLQH
ncbi:thiamine pyrophosphate-dependent enzyme [Vibrio mediterranei]|uniref:thiamine pyrophosphate-binding protein n=1 Tax=Vibrio mediterranei TaxID=689 RepID=UPI001EFD2759|nr:thiamine pyrophosphate-binding protein [Vibrio mediterranei]MCG9658796.1 thiamine pyrophosphate-dependent enzyme [Vibrio mediterranei]MCG9663338.1 thiamine pyrophosphate-dependent enzyme [Vibrio mediterranei]